MVWSVAANRWGGITESDFPQALGQAQFWPCWEQWMDGSMPRLGKLWKEEVPCLPAAPGAWKAHPLPVTESTAVITAITGFTPAHTPRKKVLMILGF